MLEVQESVCVHLVKCTCVNVCMCACIYYHFLVSSLRELHLVNVSLYLH